MARDRQRAKQRRARRRETVPPAAQAPPGGPLDHGSAGADEAAARLALGAEAAGQPAAGQPPVPEDGGATAGTNSVEDKARRAAEREQQRAVAETAVGRGGHAGKGPPAPPDAGDGANADDGSAGPPARRRERSAPAPLRAASFLRNCWAELQRVQWPDRRQVAQATGVVLLFVIIAGAYLGLADAVAQKIVDTII